MAQLSGAPVVVMGLGRFGGGIGVARWLAARGAKVTVTDLAGADALAESVRQLADLPARLHLGGHDPADLDDCRLLVVSPAVPKERSAFVREAIARGIAVTSEMNLFVERCPARRVVGVTGSAGKSTTTAMIGAVIQAAAEAGRGPRVWVGGNIGRSLLSDLEAMAPDDVVVLELSSFQLDDLAALAWSPPLAVITNLQQNHLDRHGTFEAYAEAKLNIVRYQSPEGIVFVHERDEELAGRVAGAGASKRLRRYAFDPAFAADLRVPGRHNQDNAAAAMAVACALGVNGELIKKGLAGFVGLPHRLEFVAERGGVRYFNDSKSTTPASTRLALEAFDAPVIALVGGRDKGMSFDELTQLLAKRAKGVICFGEVGEKLFQDIHRCLGDGSGAVQAEWAGNKLPRSWKPGDGPGRAYVERAAGFDEAVARASRLAEPGDVVVLSPACTSYDMFANYEQRGKAFCRLVRALPE